MTTERSARTHVPELDGLRALAISLVILYHVWRYNQVTLVGGAISYVAYAGWSGVDVFFGISGFLITGILLDMRGAEGFWRTFYVRRSLRIFPVYYAVLAALTVAGYAARARGLHVEALAGIEHIGWNYLYLTDFAMAIHGHNYVPLDIAWSLAIEEQYYLVYPLLVLRLDRRGLWRVLIAAMIVAPLCRFGVGLVRPHAVYTLPFCRMDSLAVGGLATLLVRDGSARARRLVSRAAPPLWVFGYAWVALASRVLTRVPLVHNLWAVVGYNVLAIATAATIVGLLEGSWPRAASLLRLRPVVYVGKVSYGLYLFHLFARAAVDMGPLARLFQGHHASLGLSLARLSVVYALSVAVAATSWHFFEKPLVALKDRWAPSRSSATRDPASASR